MIDAYLLEIMRQDENEKETARASIPRSGRSPAGKLALVAVAILAVVIVVAASFAGYWLLMKSRRGPASASPAGVTVSEKAPAADQGEPKEITPPSKPPAGQAGGGSVEGTVSNPPATPGGAANEGTTSGDATGADGPAPEEAGSNRPAEPGSPAPGGEPAPTGAPGLPAAPQALPPSAAEAPVPAGAAIPGKEITLLVIPLEPTAMQVLCAGREVFSGEIQTGKPLSLRCAGVFEIAMDDAGAANFSVNGERVYLGRKGQSIRGRHVSAANFTDYTQPPAETPGR